MRKEPPFPEFCALELLAELELKASSACGASCSPMVALCLLGGWVCEGRYITFLAFCDAILQLDF